MPNRRNPALAAALAALAALLAACGSSSGATGTPTITPTDATALGGGIATTGAAPTTSGSGAEGAPSAIAGKTVGGGSGVPYSGTTSGAAVPLKSPAGGKLRWYDDFEGTSLGNGWGTYDAVPRSSPEGLWKPSQVIVGNGTMTLRGQKQDDRWVTGGVSNYGPAKSTYGSYLVRFRMTRAKGIKYAILLWPTSDRWPQDGEIDFAEDGGGNRRTTTATLHWGEVDTQLQKSVSSDFSTWHTVGVDWTPGKLTYSLDGKIWATVNSRNVPSGPMDLAIQTEYVSCDNPWGECPDASTPATVDLQVDWVAVYERP